LQFHEKFENASGSLDALGKTGELFKLGFGDAGILIALDACAPSIQVAGDVCIEAAIRISGESLGKVGRVDPGLQFAIAQDVVAVVGRVMGLAFIAIPP
jgi:hypothetical protein